MESLTWVSHPARERPLASILVIILAAVIMATVYFAMDRSPVMMLIAGLIFMISLSTFFYPTTYTVDRTRVCIKYLFSAKERNLSAFRRCIPETRGVLLSPFLSPSRLENFRGFYLRYGKNNKAEVDAFVRHLLSSQLEQAPGQSEVTPDAV